MIRKGLTAVLVLCCISLVRAQDAKYKGLRDKVWALHGKLNNETDVTKKLVQYQAILDTLKGDTIIMAKELDGLRSSLAAAFAKENNVSDAMLWTDKVKDAQVKSNTIVYVAKALKTAGNTKYAEKLFGAELDKVMIKQDRSNDGIGTFSMIMYEYMELVPFKGNETRLFNLLDYAHSSQARFSADLGYYWGKNPFDARKLLFYNYAKTLVHKGALSPAAQVIASAFQSGVVPDTMRMTVIKDFEHVKGFRAALAEYELAEKQGFQENMTKLLAKTDVNGKVWSPSALKGKYLLLDFWGSWCFPCRLSHPHLKDLYAKYKDKGLEILGVGIEMPQDLEEAKAKWKKAIAEDKIDWIQYLNNEDAARFDAVKSFGVGVFPTKILLDQQGREIARYKTGKTDDLDVMLKKLFGF